MYACICVYVSMSGLPVLCMYVCMYVLRVHTEMSTQLGYVQMYLHNLIASVPTGLHTFINS